VGNTREEGEGERREGAGGIAKREERGRDGFHCRAGSQEFIVFRGTVDLVVRIGKRNQRTMTEKHPCAGSIRIPTVENGP